MDNQFNQQQAEQIQQPIPAYGEPAPAPAPAKKPIDKKLIAIIGGAVAVLLVLIIIIAAGSSSPKKTVKKYMNALIAVDSAAANECCAFDYEQYIVDYYGEDNLEELMDDDNSWYSVYDDVSDIYDSLEEAFPEYDGDIESGKDVYEALVVEENAQLEEAEYKEFEIVEVEKVDLDDFDIDDYEGLLFDEDSNLNEKDYFNTKKIKSVAEVKVKYKSESGNDSATLILVKMGGKWKILRGLY